MLFLAALLAALLEEYVLGQDGDFLSDVAQFGERVHIQLAGQIDGVLSVALFAVQKQLEYLKIILPIYREAAARGQID